MTTTNVPQPTFTPTGLQLAGEQAILAGVQADQVAAFATAGKTLSTELTTPQGQLASSEAFIVAAWQALFAQLIANVDPLTSSGAYQDALGRIYFMTRNPAVAATIPGVVVTGTPGVTATAGTLQARSPDGSLWSNQTDVTYDATTGNATVTYVAAVAGVGPVATPNTLKIYQQVNGWLGIANPNGSVAGVDVESRSEFETRRQESVSIGGIGQAANVRAAVLAVPGVTDCYVYNNGSDSAINYGATNYPIPAHSVAISVTGGADADVALAINSKLDCGCGFSGQGTTTVTVMDSINYPPPYPQYPVRFVRPPTVEVYFNVQVAQLPNVPATYIQDIQKAIVAAFVSGFSTDDGKITLSRARIGMQLIGAAYKPVVAVLNPNLIPVNIFIGTSANPTGESITMGIDQQPTIANLNVSVSQIAV
ncbi:gp33 [Burkholderia phage Bcep43]|uniref:Gp33 n=1 Tax=Burkholderia phage Bcep43 TaxID=2883945 RepID=Q6UKB7_9CAUD|nr:baseplate wedge subunit [Burkholderia phage Bcep43]AAR89325.1 gp33 [Burkholderia phage Bcep43]